MMSNHADALMGSAFMKKCARKITNFYEGIMPEFQDNIYFS